MRTLDRVEEEPVEPGLSAPVESISSEHLFAEIRFADETTEDSLEVVDEDLEEVVEEVDLEEVVEEKQNPPNQPLPLRRSPRKTKSNTKSIKLVSRVSALFLL